MGYGGGVVKDGTANRSPERKNTWNYILPQQSKFENLYLQRTLYNSEAVQTVHYSSKIEQEKRLGYDF